MFSHKILGVAIPPPSYFFFMASSQLIKKKDISCVFNLFTLRPKQHGGRKSKCPSVLTGFLFISLSPLPFSLPPGFHLFPLFPFLPPCFHLSFPSSSLSPSLPPPPLRRVLLTKTAKVQTKGNGKAKSVPRVWHEFPLLQVTSLLLASLGAGVGTPAVT